MVHQVLPCQAPLAGRPPELGSICRTITRAGAQPAQTCLCFYRKAEFPLTGCCGRPSMLAWQLLDSGRTDCSQAHLCSNFQCKTVLEAVSACPHSPADQPCRTSMPLAPGSSRTSHHEILHTSEGQSHVPLEDGARARHRGEVTSARSCCCWLIRKIQHLPSTCCFSSCKP